MRWLAASPSSGRRSSPTTRGPGAGRRSRSQSPPRTDASWPRMEPRRRPRCATSSRRSACRVGHEIKPILVARFGEDDHATVTPVAFDTQIAAYILNAALRSQTIADVVAENVDQILPPATELPATARAGLEALSALAVREPLERRLADTKLDRLFREIELPLIPVLARMEAIGVALDSEALAALDEEFRGEIERLEREIYVDVGHEFEPGQPQAARAGPVLRVEPAEGPQDEDRLLDRRVGARGAPACPPDDRQAPRAADLHEAPLDLRRGAAVADLRAGRPASHDVPPGSRLDRPPVLVRSQPPEHPDPDRARAPDSSGVRRRLARPDAARRRLLPDRAADRSPTSRATST